MSAPVDEAAQNAALRCMLGADRAAVAPSTWEVALFTDDPSNGGLELGAVGGYAAAVVANDDALWSTAPDGGQMTSALVDFGTSSAAWSDVATWRVLRDHATGDLWFAAPLVDDLAVDDAGVPVQLRLRVFWNET